MSESLCLNRDLMQYMSNKLPATTRSIACSKCFCMIVVCRSLAAINAASLQTLAISAPVQEKNHWF